MNGISMLHAVNAYRGGCNIWPEPVVGRNSCGLNHTLNFTLQNMRAESLITVIDACITHLNERSAIPWMRQEVLEHLNQVWQQDEESEHNTMAALYAGRPRHESWR